MELFSQPLTSYRVHLSQLDLSPCLDHVEWQRQDGGDLRAGPQPPKPSGYIAGFHGATDCGPGAGVLTAPEAAPAAKLMEKLA